MEETKPAPAVPAAAEPQAVSVAPPVTPPPPAPAQAKPESPAAGPGRKEPDADALAPLSRRLSVLESSQSKRGGIGAAVMVAIALIVSTITALGCLALKRFYELHRKG